uniref:Cytochrome oxidase subunit II transmembrane region profile domain-containing protein n=1 Tax=Lactuca sativa TaxID=4236 RepID=A0A9R1XH92_LACSA|nr:hypothetical protein LSAT_V11C500235050 [Lactuca sativa]
MGNSPSSSIPLDETAEALASRHITIAIARPGGILSLSNGDEKSDESSGSFSPYLKQSKNETDQMIVLEWLFLTIAPYDAAEPWQLGSQDAATPMMQGIIELHHNIFFLLILILVFVSRILVRALWHFQKEKNSNPAKNCSWNYYRDSSDHIS